MLLIFDCDGVLVDSEMIASRVLAAHLSAHGYPITAKQCRERFTGKWMTDVVGMVRDAGVDLPEDFIQTLKEKDQDAFKRELKPMPGVMEMVRELTHDRCVASSGPIVKIETTLGVTGLLPYFRPHLFSAGMVKRGKPAPDLFLHAANAMGRAPADCLVIEDSVAGVTGARRAGMRVLGFAGASHAREVADYGESLMAAGAETVFDDMMRLPDLIKGA
ncbi:MAG: HAD family hydrolase [Rhodospirillales bacterium]|tara:strand:+ start:21 stop:674 length:654 start_codon:yes stop_codon:yes gene_type:complete